MFIICLVRILISQGSKISYDHLHFLLFLWEDNIGTPPLRLTKYFFKRFLIQRDIKLVLAEFGPTGVAVTEACKEVGIPLIVIFHGYDAFHKKILNIYNEDYHRLFDYSSVIIGVSNDLCEKLLKLGAPKEKIKYLPCGVNTEHFNYSDHSENGPVFLAVGRFTETKSPHITILAFNEILKLHPESKTDNDWRERWRDGNF